MSLDAPSARAFWIMGGLALALGVFSAVAALATREWAFAILALAFAGIVGVAAASVRRIRRS